MQLKGENFALLASLIEQAKNILILVGQSPSADNLAAGLSLEETLTALNKKVQIYYRGEIPGVLNRFSPKINNRVDVKKLAVSFNWRKNQVEKVSYSLEGEHFNFIISPVNKEIDIADLKISYQGEEADMIVALGIASLSELNDLSSNFFEGKTIVNIDKNEKNQLFGKLNFVNPSAESICTLIAQMLENSQIPTSPTAAEILLLGLRLATDNFNRVVDPATFEAAAFCTMIKGGKIKQQKPEESRMPFEQPEAPKEWLSPKILRSKQTS